MRLFPIILNICYSYEKAEKNNAPERKTLSKYKIKQHRRFIKIIIAETNYLRNFINGKNAINLIDYEI